MTMYGPLRQTFDSKRKRLWRDDLEFTSKHKEKKMAVDDELFEMRKNSTF
jgi:hypothetical protein